MTTQSAEELVKTVQYWRDRAFKAENELRLYREIRRAPVLKPIDKDIIEEFRHIETYGTVKDSSEHTRANFTTIATRLHTSPDTVKRSAERMQSLGLVSIREHIGPQDQHERKYIQIDSAKLGQISQLQDTGNVVPKQGGDRYSCQLCNSSNVTIKRRLHCNDCGHEIDLEPVYPNGKNGTTGITRKSNLLLEVEPIADDTTTGITGRTPRSNLLLEETDDLLLSAATATAEESDDLQKQNAVHYVDTLYVPQIADGTPPCAITIETEDVEPPAFLRDKKIWCVHRDKVPYIAEMSRAEMGAKSSDPSTWRTYEEAKAIYERSIKEGWKKPYSGIGFMCDGTFTVLDFDHCITDGALAENVLYTAQDMDTYAEVSYSGTGVHQIGIGTIPHSVKRHGIEMYCAEKLENGMMEKGRFLTWTGKHIIGLRSTIQDCQEQLTQLHSEIAEPVKVSTFEKRAASASRPCAFTGTDDELIEKMRNARNGAKFIALFDQGDTTGHMSDNSRADLALVRILAYWTGYDVLAIDRLFRQSKLMRTKWDERHGRDTYGNITIGQVCDSSEEMSA